MYEWITLVWNRKLFHIFVIGPFIDVYTIYETTENTFIWKHQQDSTPQISESSVEMLNHMKQPRATEDQLSNATQWWWQWKSESDDNGNLKIWIWKSESPLRISWEFLN